MQRTTRTLVLALAITLLAAPLAEAGNLNGVIKLGGIFKDEQATDMSAVPETYNIYEGFSISRINLRSQLGQSNFFHLDLHEINLDSGKGVFDYRLQNVGSLTVRFDQHRQLMDTTGSVGSQRRDWRLGLNLTPTRNFRITGDFGHQTRTGDRLGYPAGTVSFLGNTYDYALKTGRIEAEINQDGNSVAIGYEMSQFEDDALSDAKRQGHVISLRLRGQGPFLRDRLSHFVRASYGVQELDAFRIENQHSDVQYLGMLRIVPALRFQYRFYGGRMKEGSTGQEILNLRNDFDLTWYNRIGSLYGGYGYVTNDSYRDLTTYNVWRVGGSATIVRGTKLKASYASSTKDDQNQRTLLRNIDDQRITASLQSKLTRALTLGVSFADRQREYPMIDVKVVGQRYGAFGRLAQAGKGAIQVDYTYSDDDYQDRVAGFRADNSAVSGRLDIESIENLRLSAGVTYLNVGKDLDIEKSILTFSGQYDFLDKYFVEAKYNVYNSDDFVLVDQYYTANVVWLNFGYRLSVN